MSTNLSNTGHGHVFPRLDGAKAKCGGPGFCDECSRDYSKKIISEGGVKEVMLPHENDGEWDGGGL